MGEEFRHARAQTAASHALCFGEAVTVPEHSTMHFIHRATPNKKRKVCSGTVYPPQADLAGLVSIVHEFLIK